MLNLNVYCSALKVTFSIFVSLVELFQRVKWTRVLNGKNEIYIYISHFQLIVQFSYTFPNEAVEKKIV